jgi:basic membrane protein A
MLKKNKEKPLRKVLPVLVAFIMSITLAGCNNLEPLTVQTSSKDFGSNTPRIGLITGSEGVFDPYYMKAWDGLQNAQRELQAGIGNVQVKTDKDYPSQLAELSRQGCEIIITLGQNAVPAVIAAAPKNPEITYLCLDSDLDKPIPANVLGVAYRIEEAAFLAGIMTGEMTTSHVVGFISGDDTEPSQKYFYGFKAGLRTADSGSELLKGIAATFTDKSRIENMTLRMVESQADVVFHVAGSAGDGMIRVMNQYGKYAIGSGFDQSNLAPETVLTSVVKFNDLVIFDLIEQYKNKELELGKSVSYGLAEKGVGLVETTKSIIPDRIQQRLRQYQTDIISGKLKIPATENAYLDFVDN